MNNMTRWRGEFQSAPSLEPERIAQTSFDDPDLSKICRSIFLNLPLIFGITIIGAIAAFVYLKSITPQFTASTLIMLDSRNTILDETNSVFAGLPIADTYFESEIELIRSDAIVKRVIEDHHLKDDAEFARGEAPPGILRLAAERALAADGGNPPEEDLLDSVKGFQVAREIRKRLKVQRRGMSQGIVISFRSRSQVKARDIADAFAQTYVLDQLNDKMNATERASAWLQSELEKLGQQTQITERAVEAYRVKHMLVGEGDQGVSVQQLRSLTSDLAVAKAAQSQADVTLNHIQQLKNAGRSPMLVSEIGEKKSIALLRAELSEADLAKSEMMERYNVNNVDQIPPLQEAITRSSALRKSLDAEINLAVSEIESTAQAAAALVVKSERELALFREQNADVNKASIGLNELEREAESKRRRYDALLAEFNKTENAAAAQRPHARIVSPAELPLVPSAPRKKPTFAAAIVLSAALGVFAALLREFFRRSIRTPEEFHSTTNLQVIGVTPQLKGARNKIAKAMNIVVKKPDDAFSQAIRSIGTELALARQHGGAMVVAVTSPANGGSAFAAGLARSMAFAKINTLLVDANLRQPEIMPALYGSHAGADFPAMMSGQARWSDGIIKSKNPPLDFIGSRKPVIERCAHLAFDDHFDSLIDAWREHYEVVIVNTAPGLALPDVRAITKRVDHTILCVEWNVDDRARVADAVDIICETNKPPMAVIVNAPARLLKPVTRGGFRRLVPIVHPRLFQP